MSPQTAQNPVVEQPRAAASRDASAPADHGRAAPAGERWGSRVRRWAAEFWLWYLFWNSRHFPWYARVTKHFFLWGAWRYSPSLRRPTLANAARILGPASTPEQRLALGKGVLSSFYDFIEDVGRSLHRTPEELRACVDEVCGEEHYRRARGPGRGAIIVTAHLGSFEVGAATLRQREAEVHVVFHRDTRAFFENMRRSLHERLGVIEAPVERGLATWFALREALARDAVVMMQGDRVMPGQAGVRVPFLGGHILLPPGPVKLAGATGAPLLPVFAVRSAPGKVRIMIEEPILCERAEVLGQRVPAPLLALARVLEKYVRAYPEQWLMLQPVWCEDHPPSSAHRGPAMQARGMEPPL